MTLGTLNLGNYGTIAYQGHAGFLVEYELYLSSILFGETMVPNIEQDSVLLLGYSIFI